MAELSLEARVENLDRVLSFVNEALEAADCPVRTQLQVDVAVEEVFVNIASYAYPDPGTGTACVRAEILRDPRAVLLTFGDRGTPYDPTAKPDPDVTLPAEARQIGGLGIYLVKKTMDRVEYRRENGSNLLTLLKRF